MFGLKPSKPFSNPWPLKFKWHNFNAYCYNTLKCSLIYNHYEFSLNVSVPSPPPKADDYRSQWNATNIIGEDFPGPVVASWVSLDGTDFHAEVDVGEIFRDRLVKHNVAKEDIPEGWLAAWGVEPLGVDILMELNDRTISVYMRAHITTKDPQIPDNPRSCHRRDLVLVWAKSY